MGKHPAGQRFQAPSIIGADVGGTFTDLVRVEEGVLRVLKVPSRPGEPGAGLAAGLQRLVPEAQRPGTVLLHGTTVGTNAFLERRGARTVLLTTGGFEDVLAIGRQTREHLYRLEQPPLLPLIPREDVLGVAERVLADGSIHVPMSDAEVARAVSFVRARPDVSVAISLLFAYANPRHENLLQTALPAASVSSQVLPEYREFERTAATALNAYLRPVMEAYLAGVENALGVSAVWIMQSNGGLVTAREAGQLAVRTLVSGPAAGVEGAFAVSSRAGYRVIMTLDVGGTSSDVALCDGAVRRTREASLDGWPLAFPMVDIHTVGAGGGSLVEVDAGGALHVGPRSAGAWPGPACYGVGKQATVTDAHLVLGRLGPHDLLGGVMEVSVERARAALGEVSHAARCTVEEAALGVIQVANAGMEKALRVISIERGHDPRRFALVPFGGAGPLHACELAGAMGMRTVLVPPRPGVLSALGLLLARQRREASLTVAVRSGTTTTEALEAVVERLRDGRSGTARRWVDVRYPGQSFELSLSLSRLDPTAIADSFHRLHQRRYGFCRATSDVEIVNVRVSLEKPGPAASARLQTPIVQQARVDTRPVYIDGQWRSATVVSRDDLVEVTGPAVVRQYDCTVWVPPGWSGRTDAHGNLVLTA